MLKTGLRRIALSVGGLALCALVLAAVAAMRLAQGPVSLPGLAPLVERALSDSHPAINAAIGDVILRWDGWEGGIDLRLADVRLRTAAGVTIASVPELGFTISSESVRQRRPLIEGIEVFRPDLRLVRHADGRFDVAVSDAAAPQQQAVSLTLADIAQPPDPATPASYLRTISITDARITIIGETGNPSAQLRLPSGTFERIGTELSLRAVLLVGSGRKPARFEVAGRYRRLDDVLDLDVRFQDLNPALLAGDLGPLPELAAIEMPFAGEGAALLDGSGAWRSVRLDTTGGAGRVVVSPELAAGLGRPALAQALAVRHARLRLGLERNDWTLAIEDFEIDFAPETTLLLSAPIDHRFPLAGIKARARAGADRIEIEAVSADLGGPKLTASGSVSGLAARPALALRAAVEGLKVDDLRRYWPPALAPGGYDWTVNHLADGTVGRAEITIAAAGDGGSFAIEKLEGTIVADGVTVDYLAPLPAVRNTAATARFDLSQFRIEVARGSALGLNLTGGTIVIRDFDKPVESIDLDLAIAGPVADALEIIGRKPLEYTKALGIDAAKAKGRAETSLKLAFPLLRELPWGKVKVDVRSRLKDVAIDGLIAGHSVTAGDLDLHVDKDGLDLAGTLAVAGIPGRALVAMNFAEKAPFRSRVEFTADRFATERLLRLMPDQPLVREAVLGGELGGRLRLLVARDGSQEIDVRIDATQAETALPPLGWHKKRGARATFDIDAIVKDQRLVRIARLAGAADDLDVRGSAQFAGDGSLHRLDAARVAHRRTDLAATVQRRGDGDLDITVSGPALDLEPLLATLRTQAAGTAAGAGGGLRVAVDLSELWFAAGQKFDRVAGKARRDARGWQQVALTAQVPAGGRISAALNPLAPAGRHLNVEAQDAGRALATLGLYSDMRGGRLELDASFDDSQPQSPLSGRLKIKDFKVVNAPLLARLLNVLALTGVVDALRGDGISFSTLEAPFVSTPGRIMLHDAKTHGAALGLTASGTVETAAEVMDIQGTIVPFYVINSALGRIPLLGGLFTGGEAGGGLFAATYAMKGALAEPEISVNPLSILGPGVLRHLFAIFDPLWSGDVSKGWPSPPADTERAAP